ncbi:MAG TPA: tRNA preQ1(34) S-adenosylmethionine ribosyltransferase-isomerase QueA [Sedimentisphaerales bacterium]|nr:tRNA preQ1(34) S-adenosylmethionine ribosyltransferase-isomerase QueA [Sedimentisphaerales bacterium]
MRTELFNYELPPELIAQHPAPVRSDSRLLVLNRAAGTWTDTVFNRIGNWLKPGDCFALNDTRVVPARFYARRRTGGGMEGLFLEEKAAGRWLVMLKNAARLRPQEKITLISRNAEDFCEAEAVEALGEGYWILDVESPLPAFEVLEEIGAPALPPYIRRQRPDKNPHIGDDRNRYQTVYAREQGSVAAPTAGLHFTDALIEELKAQGIGFARLTLHVGAGTFKPVTTDTLDEHRMHSERYSLDEENANRINVARKSGGRIVAVGTTTVRTLEAIGRDGSVQASNGATDLFIKPGHRFNVVDAIVTNFHLPQSTLLALVAAFAGLDFTMAAYRHAVEQKYRFYSYGDAMLIL